MGDVVDHAIAYIDKAIAQLSQAYVAQDWDAIQQLDEKLRVGFIDYTQQLRSTTNQHLLQRLEELIALYREVITGCEQHRSQIREQMLAVSKSQRGSRAYSSVSSIEARDLRSQPWKRR